MGKRVSRAFLLPVLSSLIAAILIGFGILRDVDRLAQDALYQHPGVPAADIAIIGIDEETLMELGPYGPGYRKVMARALEQLASVPEKMPAVVAVDILYEGQSDPEADNALAAAAEKLGCMVSASMAEYVSTLRATFSRPRSSGKTVTPFPGVAELWFAMWNRMRR